MKILYRLSMVLAAVAVFAHCATSEPYPEAWSPPIAVGAGECPDISGTFSNACTPISDHDVDCLENGGLAGLLFAKYAGSFHSKLGEADQVMISQPSSSRLLVEAWNGEELVHEDEIRLTGDHCTEGGILISTGGKGTQIEGGVGVGSSHALFNKNEQGDLIAHLRVKFTGVWFVVPVSGSSQHWKRFEALPPS